MRIGVISDTHGLLDQAIFSHLADVDEIWHAGDIGSADVIKRLEAFRPVRAVWGNIDGAEVRRMTSEFLHFTAGSKRVLLIHTGGYPGHYAPRARQLITALKPDIFVCGHSHILKVIYDKAHDMLCINPGAAGISGFHRVQTLLRFTIDGDDIREMEVVEFGTRRDG